MLGQKHKQKKIERGLKASVRHTNKQKGGRKVARDKGKLCQRCYRFYLMVVCCGAR